MFKKLALLSMLLAIFVLFAAACANSTIKASAPVGAPPPAAVLKAREKLAQELSLTTAEISSLTHKQVEWSDSCLGLGGIAESCLQATISGWRIELSANGKTYIARTDESGEQVRFEAN